MEKTYYNPEDLKKFGHIGEFQKEMADKFFAWYAEVFKDGYSEQQMMEAVHVGAAIQGGATLAHSVQMMNKVKEISI